MPDNRELSREEFKTQVKIVARRESDQSVAWDKVLDSDRALREKAERLARELTEAHESHDEEARALSAEVKRLERELDEALTAIGVAQRVMAEFKHIYPAGFPGEITPKPEHLASQVTFLCNDQRCTFQNLTDAAAELQRLRDALMEAPHFPLRCPANVPPFTGECNCWKSRALSGSSEPASKQWPTTTVLSRSADSPRRMLCEKCNGEGLICYQTGRPWSECDCGQCERGPNTQKPCPDCAPVPKGEI